MINRNLIRIKIVQLMYSYYQNGGKNLDTAEKELLFSLSKAYDLYNYLLLLMVEETRYAFEILEQKDAQSLFLLCGVLQQNSSIKIEDLVRYAFGWDMFESSYTSLQGARYRVHRMINELKDRCMLLDGDSHDTVRLHDLVHDVGVSLAKEKFMYCFNNGAEVEERLKKKEFLRNSAVAILLPNDYVNVKLLFQSMKCEKLRVIRMPQNESLFLFMHVFILEI